MAIKFGILPENEMRAIGLVSISFFGSVLSFYIHCFVEKAHHSVVRSRIPGPNATLNAHNLICGIPYEDCLCSVQLTKNGQLENCLTDNLLLGSRIFILLLFMIQICSIREFWSLSGKYIRYLVYILWIISVFIFVVITNGIYQGSCFHLYVKTVLHCSATLLFYGLIHNVFYRKRVHHYTRTKYNIAINQAEVPIEDDSTEIETDDDSTETDDGSTETETDDDSTEVEVDADPIIWRKLL
jgi:hypothetical protein